MQRRNWILAVLLTAAVLVVTALTARAEPTLPDDPTEDIPVAGTTVTDTTSPDMSITTTGEPTTTIDYSATDEYGSTLYAPTTTTTKGSTTTTKRTAITEPPFAVNPAHPEDTYNGPTPWRDLPNFYVAVTDEYGSEVTRYAPETTTQEETSTTDEESSSQTEERSTEVLDEVQRPAISWPVAAAAGAALLAALAGVIIMGIKGRRSGGEDDYIYEDTQP